MNQKLLWRCLIATTFIAASVLVIFTNTAPTNAQSWNLVWSDEFNGNSVNTNDWNFDTGGSGNGNNELEYYTSGGANTSVANGILTITAKQGSSGFNCWNGTCQYTSARINTSGKHSWTYGKFEARILIPTGQGTWPAFWMLGQNIGSVGWPLAKSTTWNMLTRMARIRARFIGTVAPVTFLMDAHPGVWILANGTRMM